MASVCVFIYSGSLIKTNLWRLMMTYQAS